MVTRWKQKNNAELLKLVEGLVPAAIQDVLGYKIVSRVLSSQVTHSALEPEGDMLSITITVQVVKDRRKEEPAHDDTGEPE